MQAILLDETSDEQLAEWRSLGADDVWGLFWVWPEERFDELVVGADVGRSEECAIRVDGSSVSRRHALVERRGPIWAVRDLGSRNGLFVNAQRSPLSALAEQDIVRVGDWVGVVCRMPRAALQRGELFSSLEPDFMASAPTWSALSNLDGLARSNLPIIIQGETGTGKEVLAQTLHHRSGRRGPLVALNCAALPEALAEAELFGHKKGAFTGAVEAARGYIASAHGGTLLLDELAELPLSTQSKLLRALEERAVVPVGSSVPIEVDFRLVATAQRSLPGLVEAGVFRADLYARLSGAELHLAPLRERRQEIVRLLRAFMGRYTGRLPHLDSRLVERLCSYAWPYNVRELHQLARLLTASSRESLHIRDLPERFLNGARGVDDVPGSQAKEIDLTAQRDQRWLSRYRSELTRLKDALRSAGGNVSEAARRAQIPRHRARRLLAAESRLSGRRLHAE